MGTNKGFVHLRLHSEYSIVDGLVRVPELVSTAARLNMPAVAITDHVNLYALIKFYAAASAAGVKPVCGCDVLIAEDRDPEQVSALALLIKNETGYHNLMKLLSRAYLEGQRQDQACIRKSWLQGHAEGLLALSGASAGDIGKALLKHEQSQAEARLASWLQLFPDNFYLELQRTGRPGDEDCVQGALDLARQFDCPVVATNDVRFIAADEFEAHEARVCINERRTLDDQRRPRRYSDRQYLRSAEEMAELFSDIPEALENSLEIARRCTLNLELGKPRLPRYPLTDGASMEDFLCRKSEAGLMERLGEQHEVQAPSFQPQLEKYQRRLAEELGIINQMGYPGYFLIVMEFIEWARQNGVPVGPGRGSGAGSLVAYALRITDIDPLQYDLLFERFLNPERISMPDIDIDFCMDGRDRVIEHVAELYGSDAVSQITTFGTMGAKAVLRDVCRVLGKPHGLGDRLAKLVPFEPGMTLVKALAQEPSLAELRDTNEEAEEVLDMAFKLEGLTRNVSKHAGGVVIAPTKLTDFSPLHCAPGGANLVTQYDMNDVESAGLVKFDFLGLRTLTIIDWAVKMINENPSRPEVDMDRIPLDDAKVYRMLGRGETTALFQLESRGMKDLIKRLKPSNFEDIIALVALYRPGPLDSGMGDNYINRKHGRETVRYPHPDLEPVLKNTYGVILYQEQVMQIAQVLADYTLGGADVLRRAMGKKKPEEMRRQREVFIAGAAGRGIKEKQAASIFDLMEKFAGYGFNKSHSAAYALVAYRTAWLKAHYPAHFMAAVLSAEMQKTDKIMVLVDECRRMGLKLLTPDVNQGKFAFSVDGQGRILYGLGAVKGVGESAIKHIVARREAGGVFQDLFDFCRRVNLSIANRRVLEALIRAGAMDELGAERWELSASLEDAVKTAEQSASAAASGVDDMFGEIVPSRALANPPDNGEMAGQGDGKRRLQEEKQALGLYLSGHPIDEYEQEISRMKPRRIADLKADERPQRVVGLVHSYRIRRTRGGDGGQYAALILDDRSARIDVTLFGEVYEQCRGMLREDAIVLAEGVVSADEYTGKGELQMRARRLMSFQEARRQHLKNITLNLQADALPLEALEKLQDILARYRPEGENGAAPGNGFCDVVVSYRREGVQGSIALGEQWRVQVEDDLLYQLKEQYGASHVALNY